MYIKGKMNDVPKRKRTGISRFERTPEWQLMKADIDKGLKPMEALQVILTEEEKAKYKIKNRRSIARFIKKYLEAKGLSYNVRNFHRDEGEFIVVENDVRAARKRKTA
jgi:hypothetical protein